MVTDMQHIKPFAFEIAFEQPAQRAQEIATRLARIASDPEAPLSDLARFIAAAEHQSSCEHRLFCARRMGLGK